MSQLDWYSVLGVEKDATKTEIKSACRELVMLPHPDRHGGAKAAEKRPYIQVLIPLMFSVGVAVLAMTLWACTPKAGTSGAPSPEVPPAIERPGPVDALGRTFTFRGQAERIVSLSPSVTEILFAIGAGDRVVGVTEFCTYPPEAAGRTKVGGFSGATISVERIAALEPDLVFLSADMHGRILALLEQLGIPSFAVEPRSFEEVYAAIALIGGLTGNPSGAEDVIASMKEKIALAEKRRLGKEKPRVFWEVWDEPLLTAGGPTFIGEAISLGGGINIFGDLNEQWPEVSAEQVLLRRPQWILAADDHGIILDPGALARRSGWGTLPAVRSGYQGLIPADMINRYGPRLADAVLAIAEILQSKDPL
jgi:iron complex transport system substrate-binding protein